MTDEPASSAATRPRAFGLPSRTVLGFTGAVLAIFVVGALARGSLLGRAASADRVTVSMEATAQLVHVVSLVKDAETGQRGYLLGGDRYLAPYTAAVEAIPAALKRARELLAHDAAQLERFDRLERLIARKLQELKLVIDKKDAGDVAGAVELVRTRGEDAMHEIRSLADEIFSIARTQLTTRNAELDRAALLSLWVTLGGLALLLLLVLASAVLSSRDFREQQWQAWLRAGLAGLGARLQGNQTLDELGDNAVRYLAEYLGARVGAIYFSGGRELCCVGRYALGPEQAKRPGGLNAQVLKDGTTAVIEEVPASYFEISSALGATVPRRLLIAATTIDGERNGTIELGFLGPLPRLARELVERGGEILGVALRAASYRREVEALLEETQRQAEELQTQQEELRVSNEELAQQSQTLIASQAKLQKQQAEVEEINSQLAQQTETLAAQRDELVRAQAELQRASAYKSEFLANMSHELRTPLNSSLILARLLADNRDGNLTGEQVKFAETIYTSGNDLLLLINDILDLAKIEAGKLDVRTESVSPQQIVDQLKAIFLPIANEKHLSLETVVEPAVPAQLLTDGSRLQQILKNLLSNACKFTDRGAVTLEVRRTPDARVAFSVTDTGIGIASDQQALIFDAFRQADGTNNRRYGGTGLGLSISRDLARLLGGELGVESAPGRGSTFTLVMPTSRAVEARTPRLASPARQAARPRLPTVIDASVDDDRAKVGASSRAILIIEDDVEFLRVVQGLAREHDFMTLGATTAEEGLALAERFRPSAIVLDLHLPDRSGLTVLDTLKHSPLTRHIPVHVISGSDHTQAALQMGAAGYAVKPIHRDELVDVLRGL